MPKFSIKAFLLLPLFIILTALFLLPSPVYATTVQIRAWGQPYLGNPKIALYSPLYQLYYDPNLGTVINGTKLSDDLEVTATDKASANVFSVTVPDDAFSSYGPSIVFLNDRYGGSSDTDRNVFIDYIVVNGVKVESEAPDTLSYDCGNPIGVTSYQQKESLGCYDAFFTYYIPTTPQCSYYSSTYCSGGCTFNNVTSTDPCSSPLGGFCRCANGVAGTITACSSSYSCSVSGFPTVTPSPNCTSNPTNCGVCSAAANTCSTGNGSQTCTLTGPSPCTQVSFTQACTINNCSSGYTCQSGSCVIPVQVPTVDLKVNGVDGVGGLDNNSTVNLSWITGNSPTSCTLYIATGSGWVPLGNQSLSTPNVTTGQLAGPATYLFGMYCFNGAGISNFDWVSVGINAAPSCNTSPSCEPSCGGASANTCGTNNGTQTCTYTAYSGGGACTQVSFNQACTINNCSSGYNCQSGSCVIPVQVPTVDLKVNNSDGPVTIGDTDSVSLSWSTTNSPTSCTASGSWSGIKSTSGGSENSVFLTWPNTYTYTITCSNSAGSATDSVTVSVSGPPPPPIPPPEPTTVQPSFSGSGLSVSVEQVAPQFSPISLTTESTTPSTYPVTTINYLNQLLARTQYPYQTYPNCVGNTTGLARGRNGVVSCSLFYNELNSRTDSYCRTNPLPGTDVSICTRPVGQLAGSFSLLSGISQVINASGTQGAIWGPISAPGYGIYVGSSGSSNASAQPNYPIHWYLIDPNGRIVQDTNCTYWDQSGGNVQNCPNFYHFGSLDSLGHWTVVADGGYMGAASGSYNGLSNFVSVKTVSVYPPITPFTMNRNTTGCPDGQPHIYVSWNPAYNHTLYILFRFDSFNGSITPSALLLSPNQTSVDDTNVQLSHSYAYAVLAVNTDYKVFYATNYGFPYTWSNNLPQSAPTADASTITVSGGFTQIQNSLCQPTVSCSVSPSSATTDQTVAWSASGGGANPTYSWSGDVSGSGSSITTSYSTGGLKTATVTATSGGITSLPASCSITISQPPTITSLEIKNTGNTSFSGKKETSGRQSNQEGSNWNNSIDVTLNVNPGSLSIPHARYEVKFNSGFTLSYHDNGFYVDENLIDPIAGKIVPGKVSVFTVPSNTNLPNSVAWRVFFDKNFGDKDMRIDALVTDGTLSDSETDCTENNSSCRLSIR